MFDLFRPKKTIVDDLKPFFGDINEAPEKFKNALIDPNNEDLLYEEYVISKRKTTAPLIEYYEQVSNCLNSIVNEYKYIREYYFSDKDQPGACFVLYVLISEDMRNATCIVFGSILWSIQKETISNTVPEERKQLMSRNAPLLYKLTNAFNRNVDFSTTQFIAATETGGFINIPLIKDGNEVIGPLEKKETFIDLFSFVGNVVIQTNRYCKLLMQRINLLHLMLDENTNSKTNFFTYDRMKPCLIEVNELKDSKLQNEILYNREAKRMINLSDDMGDPSDESEIEEHFKLVTTDNLPVDGLDVFISYTTKWFDNTMDFTYRIIGKIDMDMLLNEYDDYELKNRMPTLYKAYINGLKGLFQEGALICTTKISFFIVEVENFTERTDLDEWKNKADKACFNIMHEFSKFWHYRELREKKESDRKTDLTQSAWTRYVGIKLLASLFA